MYARVVRFSDVTSDRIDRLVAEIEAAEGPPPGISTVGLRLYFDEEQGTAIVLQLFDAMQDMADAEAVFGAMDPGETPGTRASVDRCELKLDRQVG